MHINICFLVVKPENDWRYFWLVVVGNYVTHSKDFSVFDCSIGDWRMVFFF